MVKFVTVLILCSVLYGGYYVYSSYSEIDNAADYAALSFSLLKDVSSDWSYLSLKKHIDPESFAAGKEAYIEMLKKASYLGKAEACHDLKLANIQDVESLKNLEIEGKVLVGGCSFENGKAQTMHVFKLEHGKPVTIIFTVYAKQ